MTLCMTGRERLEYLRWKQEREKIDQERLQRHRKPSGQWRREWDAEKTDGMFKDGPAPTPEPSASSGNQPWARPPKPPTFGEFLSQHKAEVNSRRRRKNARPPAKPASRAYSDHDDRWETKEAVAPSSDPPQLTPPEEPHTQAPEASVPTHLPPEDEGEEDEEWEDISGDESEEDMEEEEEGAAEEEEEKGEEEPVSDQPQEASPPGHPFSEPTGSPLPESPEPPPPAQAPATPTSPFLSDGNHQPVSDWGEEMELNSPRSIHPASTSSPGGDQPAPASLDTGPNLPRSQQVEEEEGSEAAPETGPEPQETAEITDFQRAAPSV